MLFAVDLGSVLQDLLKLEKVVNSVPHAEELEKQLKDSQEEIERLKQTEAELGRLRAAYRKLAAQHSTSGLFGQTIQNGAEQPKQNQAHE